MVKRWVPIVLRCALLAFRAASAPGVGPDSVHAFGGQATKDAFHHWLRTWRRLYIANIANQTGIPELEDSVLPRALRGRRAKVLYSQGGAASGVVTEGIGYGIMVEGFEAAKGSKEALSNGLALTKAWLGMVAGPSTAPHPLGGGTDIDSPASAVKVGNWPYGVSAIEGPDGSKAASGAAAWKWPLYQCDNGGCIGSASDADADATLGLVYLAGALGYPDDFVDLTMRSVIAFASADLGFPDLYRTLPMGDRVYVVKGGSMWGGLLPPGGKYHGVQEPWCYSPGYFAPAHYRVFRDFIKKHWKPEFDKYLPPHLPKVCKKTLGLFRDKACEDKAQEGEPTSASELRDAFDGAVAAGYNILYRASCGSGAVANWVGVKAECESDEDLHCAGVPWAHTPYVGPDGGNCSASGTPWGSYGPDGSRAPWRVALDYVLFPEESTRVTMYDDKGYVDTSIWFNAKVYLNRFAQTYFYSANCNGGHPSTCLGPRWWDTMGVVHRNLLPYKLARAYDTKYHPKYLTCDNVPVEGETWWMQAMSYPTFTAFVAPYDNFNLNESSTWLDTFSQLCSFNHTTGEMGGDICGGTYFEASQEVICTQIMAGAVPQLPREETVVSFNGVTSPVSSRRMAISAAAVAESVGLGVVLLVAGSVIRRRHNNPARQSRRVPLYSRTLPLHEEPDKA